MPCRRRTMMRRADRERRRHPDWHRTAVDGAPAGTALTAAAHRARRRSEEHTSELQSLMRTSYAVVCLNTKIPPYICALVHYGKPHIFASVTIAFLLSRLLFTI